MSESTALTSSESTINDERATRRAKRKALIEQGINPYPISSTITAFARDLETQYGSLEDGGASSVM